MTITALTLLVALTLIVSLAWLSGEIWAGSRSQPQAQSQPQPQGWRGWRGRWAWQARLPVLAARHDPFVVTLFGLAIAISGYLVLGDPVKGIANSGDWQRLLYQLNLGPVHGHPLVNGHLTQWVQRVPSRQDLPIPAAIANSPHLFNYYYHYVSSELGLIKLALFAHNVTGLQTVDIRWIGFANLVPLLIGLAAIIVATRQLRPGGRRIVVALLLLAFVDPGYTLYLNSYYSEPATLAFLLLAIGAALSVFVARRPRLAFCVYVLAVMCYALAKTDDALPAVPFVIATVPLAVRAFDGGLRDRRVQLVAIGGVVASLAAVAWTLGSELQYFTFIHEYDTVFVGLLPHTSNPAGVLQGLGLSPTLGKYAGFEAFDQAHSAFAQPFINSAFFQHISTGRILAYYLTHPGALWSAISYSSAQAPSLRVDGYLSNLTTGSGAYAPHTPWTILHQDLLPHDPLILLIPIATIAIAVLALRRRARSDWRLWIVLLAVAVSALASFIQPAITNGAHELVKHEFQFNVEFDICLIALIAAAATWVAERRHRQSAQVPRQADAAVIEQLEPVAAAMPASSTVDLEPVGGFEPSGASFDGGDVRPLITCPVCDGVLAVVPHFDSHGRRVARCPNCGNQILLTGADQSPGPDRDPGSYGDGGGSPGSGGGSATALAVRPALTRSLVAEIDGIETSPIFAAPASPPPSATSSARRATTRRDRIIALIELARPRQWMKNALVAAAPFAAGDWTSASVVARTMWAAVLFTLTAAGCYMVNDVRDIERDRWHPTKRFRPLAAGRTSIRLAMVSGVSLLAAGPMLAVATQLWALAAILTVYAAVTMAYSFGLKNVPLLEIAVVASGFVLRPLAGAAATGIAPSDWFLGVICGGAVLIALGKRSAELAIAGADGNHRTSLRHYSHDGLRLTRIAVLAALQACYLGWVITRPAVQVVPAVVSFAGLSLGIARFQLLSEAGRAGAPERLLLSDRVLQIAAVVWLAALVWGSTYV